VGILIVLNLAIGFFGFLNVDNFAHVGGLLAGMWLAVVLPPARSRPLRRHGSRLGATRRFGDGYPDRRGRRAARRRRWVIAYGTGRWQADPGYRYLYGAAAVRLRTRPLRS